MFDVKVLMKDKKFALIDWKRIKPETDWHEQSDASDLIRRGAKRIEQSREAVRQQKAIEKKLELNPESRI